MTVLLTKVFSASLHVSVVELEGISNSTMEVIVMRSVLQLVSFRMSNIF